MRGVHTTYATILLAAFACSPVPPPPTPLSETARLLRRYEEARLPGPALQDSFNLMTQWPANGDIRVAYGRIFYEAGKLTEAEGQIQRALRGSRISREGRAGALLLQARLAFAQGDWADAAARCDDALAVQPGARWPVVGRAQGLQLHARQLAKLDWWSKWTTDHFVFHYPPVSPRAAQMPGYVADLAERREEALRRMVEAFRTEPVGLIHIYLHSTDDEAAVAAGGTDHLAEPRGRRIHEGPGHDGIFATAQMLTAELGEHLIYAPAIQDGAARYLADLAATGKAAPAELPTPVNLFLANYEVLPPSERLPGAAAVVAALIDQHGAEKFTLLWDRLAWEPVDGALATVYGANLSPGWLNAPVPDGPPTN